MFFDHRTVKSNATCPKCGISAKELQGGKICLQDDLCLSRFIRNKYHSLSRQYRIMMRLLSNKNNRPQDTKRYG